MGIACNINISNTNSQLYEGLEMLVKKASAKCVGNFDFINRNTIQDALYSDFNKFKNKNLDFNKDIRNIKQVCKSIQEHFYPKGKDNKFKKYSQLISYDVFIEQCQSLFKDYLYNKQFDRTNVIISMTPLQHDKLVGAMQDKLKEYFHSQNRELTNEEQVDLKSLCISVFYPYGTNQNAESFENETTFYGIYPGYYPNAAVRNNHQLNLETVYNTYIKSVPKSERQRQLWDISKITNQNEKNSHQFSSLENEEGGNTNHKNENSGDSIYIQTLKNNGESAKGIHASNPSIYSVTGLVREQSVIGGRGKEEQSQDSVATVYGTTVDYVARKFFANLDKMSVIENLTTEQVEEIIGKVPNLTTSDALVICKSLQGVVKELDKKNPLGYKIYSDIPYLIGKFKDRQNLPILIGGQIDLLVEDQNGNLHIIDLKTSKDVIERVSSRYQQQLALYKAIIEQNSGAKVVETSLLVFHTGLNDLTEDAEISFTISDNGLKQITYNKNGQTITAGTVIGDKVLKFDEPELLTIQSDTKENTYFIPTEVHSYFKNTKAVYNSLGIEEETKETIEYNTIIPDTSPITMQVAALYDHYNPAQLDTIGTSLMQLASKVITALYENHPDELDNQYTEYLNDVDLARQYDSREEFIQANNLNILDSEKNPVLKYLKEKYFNTQTYTGKEIDESVASEQSQNPTIEDGTSEILDTIYNNIEALIFIQQRVFKVNEGLHFDEALNTEDDLEDTDEDASAYEKETTMKEAWIDGKFNKELPIAPEIKRFLSTIQDVDERNSLKSLFGIPVFLDASKECAKLKIWLCNAGSLQDMIAILAEHAVGEQWINTLIHKLQDDTSSNNTFRQIFYRNFSSKAVHMSIITSTTEEDNTVTYYPILVNVLDTKQGVLDAVENSYTSSGYSFIYNVSSGVNHTTINFIKNTYIATMQDIINKGKVNPKDLDIKAFSYNLTNALQGLGIKMDPANIDLFVYSALSHDILQRTLNTCVKLYDMINNANEGNIYNDTDIKREYKKFVDFLFSYITASIKPSVYENGKTYNSFVNPSFLDNFFSKVHSLEGEDLAEYIKSQYYDSLMGYTDSMGNCSYRSLYLSFLTNPGNTYFRKLFDYEILLNNDKVDYRDQMGVQYASSLLFQYFLQNDQFLSKVAKYSLPITSNKPYAGFFTSLRLSQKDILDSSFDIYNMEIIRIAGVLQRAMTDNSSVMKNFDISEDKAKELKKIEGFKERVKQGTLTMEDLQNPLLNKSGAQFSLLFFLNNEVQNNSSNDNFILISINNALSGKIENIIDIKDNYMKTYEHYMNIIAQSEYNKFESKGVFQFDKADDGHATMKFLGNMVEKEFLKEHLRDDASNVTEADLKETLEEMMQDFTWNDFFAKMNIIMITTTDTSYYSNTDDFIKRYSQIHSPISALDKAAKLNMDGQQVDCTDGKTRFITLKDPILKNTELVENIKHIFDKRIEEESSVAKKKQLEITKQFVLEKYKDIKIADSQSFTCPTGYMKLLAESGQLSPEIENAFNEIRKGNFDLGFFNILLQPKKTFLYSREYKQFENTDDGQLINILHNPLQVKDSEYMLFLANAILESDGSDNALTTLYEFLEATHYSGRITYHDGKFWRKRGVLKNEEGTNTTRYTTKNATYEIREINGKPQLILISSDNKNEFLKNHTVIQKGTFHNNGIDRIVFESAVKVGSINAVDIENKTSEELYTELTNNTFTDTTAYNTNIVHEIDLDNYGIQQATPAHAVDHLQLEGVQMRVLAATEAMRNPDAIFTISNSGQKDYKMKDSEIYREYQNLIAAKIRKSAQEVEKLFMFDEQGVNKKIQDSYAQAVHNKDIGVFKQALLTMINNGEISREVAKDLIAHFADASYISKVHINISQEQKDARMSSIIEDAINNDPRYSIDLLKSCFINSDTHTFYRPLGDPLQSARIEQLLNSIVRKEINKQYVSGGPLIQATSWGHNSNLHVRFKSENGQIILTENEYKELEDTGALLNSDLSKADIELASTSIAANLKYADYVKAHQKDLAYYEAYMGVTDSNLISLLTKANGEMMSMQEAVQKGIISEEMRKAISYRIPTESHHSMFPIRIKEFVPVAAGQVIMLPNELPAIAGIGFDGDKLYTMVKEIFVKNIYDAWSKTKDDKLLHDLGRLYKQSKKDDRTKNLTAEQFLTYVKWATNYATLSVTGKEEAFSSYEGSAFLSWYLDNKYKFYKTGVLSTEKADQILDASLHNKQDNATTINSYVECPRKSLNNKTFDLQWSLLTNENAQTDAFVPSNYAPIKQLTDEIEQIYDKQQRDKQKNDEAYLSNRYPTLASSNVFYQEQNMSGLQLVGSLANHLTSHAFMMSKELYLKTVYNKQNRYSFMFNEVLVQSTEGGSNIHTRLDHPYSYQYRDESIIDNTQRNGDPINVNIMMFLAAALDLAKDSTINKANVTKSTISPLVVLIRLGFSPQSALLLMSQPIIREYTNECGKSKDFVYAKTAINTLKTTYFSDIKTNEDSDVNVIQNVAFTNQQLREGLKADLNGSTADKNFQYQCLMLFSVLNKIAPTLTALNTISQFNSIKNSAGPESEDNYIKTNKLHEYDKKVSLSKMAEVTDENGHAIAFSTILSSDTILDEFYSRTLGPGGIVNKIMSPYMVQYTTEYQTFLNSANNYFVSADSHDNKFYKKMKNYYYLTHFTQKYTTGNDETTQVLPTSKEELLYYYDIHSNTDINIEQLKKTLENDEYSAGNFYILCNAMQQLYPSSNLFNRIYIKKTQKIPTVAFNISGLTPEEQFIIRQELANYARCDSNSIEYIFAKQLFTYSLLINGIGFSPQSPSFLFSMEFEREMQEYTNTVKRVTNINKQNLEVKNGTIDQTAFDSFTSNKTIGDISSIIVQMMRNNTNDARFCPKVSAKAKVIKRTENGKNIYKISYNQSSKNTVYNIITSISNNKDNFAPVIKYKGKILVLDNLNNRQSIQRESGLGSFYEITYVESEPLGILNKCIEFDTEKDAYYSSVFDELKNPSKKVKKMSYDEISQKTKNTGGEKAQEAMAGQTELAEYEQQYMEIKKKQLTNPISISNDTSFTDNESDDNNQTVDESKTLEGQYESSGISDENKVTIQLVNSITALQTSISDILFGTPQNSKSYLSVSNIQQADIGIQIEQALLTSHYVPNVTAEMQKKYGLNPNSEDFFSKVSEITHNQDVKADSAMQYIKYVLNNIDVSLDAATNLAGNKTLLDQIYKAIKDVNFC